MTRVDFVKQRPLGSTDNSDEQAARMRALEEDLARIRDLYASSVRDADDRIGSIVKELKGRGVWVGNGELYTERIYTFAPETPEGPTVSFHYLLRILFDGKILNSLLLSEGPTEEMQVNIVADLAYQAATEQLYAATHFEGTGRIQEYDLIGVPQEIATLDEVPFHWQNAVALSADQQGQVYIFVGDPKVIYELGQDNLLTALYGFRDLAAEKDYPAVTHLLPGTIGIPMIMTVSPDGSMLFLIEQNQGQINLTAYALDPQ
jgi:hypothetical protein